ncbi:hypothetical protein [Olsenella phocaeensis]|uniref:hypothetical protein n=1 Tax=Olsenella phocaeensis TaxID=1852385 RepID=UPI003A90C5A9
MEGFHSAMPAARRLLVELTGGAVVDAEANAAAYAAYQRAVCAAVDAFAEFGSGQVGGFSLGDFKVSQYVSDRVATGAEQATAAAVAELYGTGLAFCGVR